MRTEGERLEQLYRMKFGKAPAPPTLLGLPPRTASLLIGFLVVFCLIGIVIEPVLR